MKLRITLTVIAVVMLLGFAAIVTTNGTDSIRNLQSSITGIGGDSILMQDDNPAEDPPADEEPSEDEEGSEDSDNDEEVAEGDSEDTSGDEETSDEDVSEEESEGEESDEEAPATGGDTLTDQMAGQTGDTNLQDALAGIADYEVTYDTSISHADNTPQALRTLGVTYAGEESSVAQRTQALNALDLLEVLSNRYEQVENIYAADPDEDFLPDDPERTMNYFEPRDDPFVITNIIPDELRPELEGTGLDGAVDPELLSQLWWAEYAANLRMVPIIVIGTIEAGPARICMYTIAGMGFTDWIEEGESRCWWYGAPFSLTCSQVSEDFVVLILRGTYDYRCSYPATTSVVRTFHISSN